MKDSRNPIRIAPVKQEEERPVLPFHSLEMAAPMNNEAKYQALFQYMPIGFAFNEIITDDQGNPVDYIFLEMNDEFTRMTGISPEHALGKKVTEVEPRILNQEEDWIERYGEVALRGKTFHLERYSETYGRWYRQTAYSPERGTFVSLLMDITEQKQLQHKLEELVEEKKRLVKEMNHRIKNNLFMVSSLIHLKETGPEKEKTDLSDLANQVEAVRLLHEKLFESENADTIHVGEYIKEILYVIFSSNVTYKVEQKMEIEDGQLPAKVLLPLALIINELATNAVKHGFTKEGRASDGATPIFSIVLKKKKAASAYTLAVSNNGPPLPEEVELSEKSGFGLGLVSLLSEQLGGTALLERAPHPKFIFEFPVP